MLVAVHLVETSARRPYIGKVIEINEDQDNVSLSWMRGSWSGGWTPGGPRNNVSYITTIPKNSLILWGFQLTESRRLRKKTILELKSKYEELDN